METTKDFFMAVLVWGTIGIVVGAALGAAAVYLVKGPPRT
jgi:hypothetical protein